MSYEYITKYSSRNYGYSSDGSRPHGQNNPKEIIIHHWGSEGQTFMGVINWFLSPSCGTSAHYVVEAGKVACLVDCRDSAWHAGNGYVNNHSIGIECRPECSDGDFNTTAELIADIWKVYGKLPLRGHKDVVPTGCPGKYYPRLKELYKLAETYYNGGKPEPKPTPKPDDDSLYRVQVGAFKVKTNAERMKKKLQAQGYDAFVVKVK